MAFRHASDEISDFLLSVDDFKEPTPQAEFIRWIEIAWRRPWDYIPLSWRDRSVGRLDSRLAVAGAMYSAAKSQGVEPSGIAVDAPAWLFANLDELREIMDIAEASDLGGIPLFRPHGLESGDLPLYDFLDSGNLEKLGSLSSLGLRVRREHRLSPEDAGQLREAMQADGRIEIHEDAKSARRAVFALYGVDIEETVRAFFVAPPAGPPAGPPPGAPPVPPGHVFFTLQTHNPGITVEYWPHAVRKASSRMAHPTGLSMSTSDVLHSGTYGFSTPDRNQPLGIDDTGSHGVWTHSPHSTTSSF